MPACRLNVQRQTQNPPFRCELCSRMEVATFQASLDRPHLVFVVLPYFVFLLMTITLSCDHFTAISLGRQISGLGTSGSYSNNQTLSRFLRRRVWLARLTLSSKQFNKCKSVVVNGLCLSNPTNA